MVLRVFFFIYLILSNHSSAQQIDVVNYIKNQLRIPSGPYTSGYVVAPDGYLNWYFANLGLISIVQYMNPTDLDFYIRRYLDLYLTNLNANFTIDDVNFPNGHWNWSNYNRVAPDSDDSYASTFLSLVSRYLTSSNNQTWWSQNLSKLKNIAYYNLALSQKPNNGLISVFQPPASNTQGYLMDNCENYRGLRDFAKTLRFYNDSDADYYDLVATGVSNGISRLFNSTGFVISDAWQNPDPTTFYPGITCQVFPQAYGVSEVNQDFNVAWAFLNNYAPKWPNCSIDSYPWAILGFVAALRGQTSQALTQIVAIENMFHNASTNSYVIINELGFYLRTKNLISGSPISGYGI